MAISRIASQDVTPTGVGGASITATYPATPTPGNTLIASVYATTAPGTVVLDGWTAMARAGVGTTAGGDGAVSLWRKTAGQSEPRAVTATATGSAAMAISIAEYAGVDGAATPTTGMNSSGTPTVSTLLASGSGALTADAGTLVLAAWGNKATNLTDYSVTPGTLLTPASGSRVNVAQYLPTSSETVNPALSWTGAARSGAVLAVLRPASTGTPTAPTSTVAPAVTGTAAVGSTLTCDGGTWDQSVTRSYQWQRDGSAISGATASTYTVTSSDAGRTVRCAVSATANGLTTTANSPMVNIPTPTVTPAPAAVDPYPNHVLVQSPTGVRWQCPNDYLPFALMTGFTVVDEGFTDVGVDTQIRDRLLALLAQVGGSPAAGAPGKSAYELAVQQGYPGTLTQWLASLVGKQGDPGSSTAASLRTSLLGTGMLPLGGNAAPGLDVATDGGRWSRIQHRVLAAGYEWRLVYANFVVGNFGEVPTANPIKVRASLEVSGNRGQGNLAQLKRLSSGSVAYDSTVTYAIGDAVTSNGKVYTKTTSAAAGAAPGGSAWAESTLLPVHFPGEGSNREVTIQPGQVVVSQPVAVDMDAGVLAFSHTWVTPAGDTPNTGSYPANTPFQPTSDYVETSATGTAPTDYTLAPPTTLATARNGVTFGPVALLGIPKAGPSAAPVLVWVGDSIGDSSNDNALVGSYAAPRNGGEKPGWLARAFGGLPHMRITRGGDQFAGKWAPGVTAGRKALFGGGSHLVVQMGANEPYTTLAAWQARYIEQWGLGLERGMKIWQATTMPQANSTDGYVTVDNQTASGNMAPGGAKEQWNAWLRDGAPMLNGSPAAAGSTASGVIRCRYLSAAPGQTAGTGTSVELPGWSAAHPLTGVVDVSKAVEAPSDSTKWAIGMMTDGDGVHPIGTGHDAAARTVDLAKFQTP